MHIVSLKKGLTVDQAKKDSEGIAVLGFFLNVWTRILVMKFPYAMTLFM